MTMAHIKPGTRTQPNANGTYEGLVEMFDAKGEIWVSKKNVSTFFPSDWSRARIEFEVTEAFKLRQMHGNSKWTGTSPSGIVIEGYTSPNRTTFYPTR